MRMGVLFLGVMVVSVCFLSGCTEQTGVEVEVEEFEFFQSSVLISKLEVVHGYEGEKLFRDSVATVLVYAANVGPEVGMKEFYFSINGMVMEMKTVSFLPGEEVVVSFSTECTDCDGTQSYLSDIGRYRLAVNDFETMVEVVESPVLLRIESITWHEAGLEEDQRYIPSITVYLVNMGDGEYPLDYWELMVDGEIVTDIAPSGMSTAEKLSAYGEGQVVLTINGIYSSDENGRDVKLSTLWLRDQPSEGYYGGILGSIKI